MKVAHLIENIDYCTILQYDDYNWDWSLQHVSLNCMKEKMQVMLSKGPRVFHIGEWWEYKSNYPSYSISALYCSGVHHKKSNCNSRTISEKVKKIIKSAKSAFFPQRYQIRLSITTIKTSLFSGYLWQNLFWKRNRR